MYAGLSPGAIGVSASNLDEAIAKAVQGGFAGVEVNPAEFADNPAAAKAKLDEAGLKACGFGLPLDWRGDEDAWKASLEKMPALAKAAAAVGATRCATWILPMSDERDFEANAAFHRERLAPGAAILADHGIAFGMEFIGPKTLRDRGRYPFVHTMKGMLDLGAQIGPNVGLLLDAWHLYTSHGTADEVRSVPVERVVYVHVNDAPAGVPIDEQVDNVRCLPGETGVIDLAAFFAALQAIGYDGPIVVEPFNQGLNELPDDAARLRAVRDSLRGFGI